MDRPYVETLRIQNYGCIQDATFRFTPLHALIGPNDSGKSTVLRALLTLASMGTMSFNNLYHEDFLANPGAVALEAKASSGTVRLAANEHRAVEQTNDREAMTPLRDTQLLRLDPDFLRLERPLIPDTHPLRFTDERGTGLPALYDALLVRNLPAYIALNQDLARLFPSVKSIQLTNPSATTKAVGIKLTNNRIIHARRISEGMLYYLAFAIVPYLDPAPPLLLIEEPENGLHPARIAEVMRVLRKISETTQVILATHSPLVINEMQPDEVTVVTRTPERGTKATLMKDTADFEERSKVYALGELWLSYANGEDEGPLLHGGPRP